MYDFILNTRRGLKELLTINEFYGGNLTVEECVKLRIYESVLG